MAPFVVVAIVAASLFGTGTVIKPEAPQAGTVLQLAGVGTLAGGAIGSIAGVATAASVSTATAVTGGAIGGGLLGTAAGYEYTKRSVK